MDESLVLSVVTSALPATMSFLWQRVERLLSRGAEPDPVDSVPATLDGALVLPLEAGATQLRQRQDELEQLRDVLVHYAEGRLPMDAADPVLMRNLGRLRVALEDIYGQRFTFSGERRPASGPFTEQKIDFLAGEAIGMDADAIADSASVIQDVRTVEPGGSLIGMRARRIGKPGRQP